MNLAVLSRKVAEPITTSPQPKGTRPTNNNNDRSDSVQLQPTPSMDTDALETKVENNDSDKSNIHKDSQRHNSDSYTDKDNAYKQGYNPGLDISTAHTSSYHNSLTDGHKAPLVSDKSCDNNWGTGCNNNDNNNYLDNNIMVIMLSSVVPPPIHPSTVQIIVMHKNSTKQSHCSPVPPCSMKGVNTL